MIIAIRVGDSYRVEFRGRPYSQWDAIEDTPMYRLHACLQRIDISALHANEVVTVTPWHSEWRAVKTQFDAALTSTAV